MQSRFEFLSLLLCELSSPASKGNRQSESPEVKKLTSPDGLRREGGKGGSGKLAHWTWPENKPPLRLSAPEGPDFRGAVGNHNEHHCPSFPFPLHAAHDDDLTELLPHREKQQRRSVRGGCSSGLRKRRKTRRDEGVGGEQGGDTRETRRGKRTRNQRRSPADKDCTSHLGHFVGSCVNGQMSQPTQFKPTNLLLSHSPFPLLLPLPPRSLPHSCTRAHTQKPSQSFFSPTPLF